MDSSRQKALKMLPTKFCVALLMYGFVSFSLVFSVYDNLTGPSPLRQNKTPSRGRGLLGVSHGLQKPEPAGPNLRIWVAHVSVPLFDKKGSDERFTALLHAMAADRHQLLYIGYMLEKGQEDYHLTNLVSTTNATVLTPARDAPNAREQGMEVFPCDVALLYFWPTTDYWQWLGELMRQIRMYQPQCEVLVLADEPFWPRWKSVQDAQLVDMSTLGWITRRWDLLRANILKFFSKADKLAFITEQDRKTVGQLLPSRLESSFVLPYSMDTRESTTPWEKLSGVLFLCSDAEEHVPFLKEFLTELMTGLTPAAGQLHIVGAISRYFTGDFLSTPAGQRMVVHAYMSEDALGELEESVFAMINPLSMGGGVSTKVLRGLGKGRPVVATTSSIPSTFLHGAFCNVQIPSCNKGEVACFQAYLGRLKSDKAYWQALADCGVRYMEAHHSQARLQDALRRTLNAPRYHPQLPGAPVTAPQPDFTGSGVYVALILSNVEAKWDAMSSQLLGLVDELQRRQRPSFVSIFSSNNKDKTEELLNGFRDVLSWRGVPNEIRFSLGDEYSELKKDRPSYLALMRNKALEYLNTDYGTTLFINDIYIEAEDLVALLDTPVDYDMVCGLDFSYSDFNLNANLTVTNGQQELCFYDIWVARDIDGGPFVSHFPWATAPQSQQAVRRGQPFQVYSCWNGAVAFRSATYLYSALRFRGTAQECPSSECQLWCKDLWDVGYSKVYINPRVQSAYEKEIFERVQATPYYKQLHAANTSLAGFEAPPVVTERPSKEYCCLPSAGGLEPDWENCDFHHNIYKPSVAIVGNVLDQHSFAEANRNLAVALRKHASKVLLFSQHDDPFTFLTDHDAPKGFFAEVYIEPAAVQTVDLAIHNSWPPVLERFVPATKTVIMLPWEFGSLPADWIPKLNKFDEVWVPTTFLKVQYARDGVKRSKIQVVPNQIASIYFEEQATDWPFEGGKAFNFLYIGGILLRKGTDAMLRAYQDEFTSEDNVCLTVVSQYAWDDISEGMLKHWGENDSAPCLVWKHKQYYPLEDVAKMMASASVYVATYRAEGFGLPPVQALALGTPLIVTRGGASNDYASDDIANMVESEEAPCTIQPCEGNLLCVFDVPRCLRLVNPPTYREPAYASIRTAMRKAVENIDELKVKAAGAKAAVRARFSSKAVAEVVRSRLPVAGAGTSEPLIYMTEEELKALERPWVAGEAVAHDPSLAHSNAQLAMLLQNLREVDTLPITRDRFAKARGVARTSSTDSLYLVHAQYVGGKLYLGVPQGCPNCEACLKRLKNLVPALQHIFYHSDWESRDFEFLLSLKPGEDDPPYPLLSFRSPGSEAHLLVPDPVLLQPGMVPADSEDTLAWGERKGAVLFRGGLTTLHAVRLSQIAKGRPELDVGFTSSSDEDGRVVQLAIESSVALSSKGDPDGFHKACLVLAEAAGSLSEAIVRWLDHRCAFFLPREEAREFWSSGLTEDVHYVAVQEDFLNLMQAAAWHFDGGGVDRLEGVAKQGSHALRAILDFESVLLYFREALKRYVRSVASDYEVIRRKHLIPI